MPHQRSRDRSPAARSRVLTAARGRAGQGRPPVFSRLQHWCHGARSASPSFRTVRAPTGRRPLLPASRWRAAEVTWASPSRPGSAGRPRSVPIWSCSRPVSAGRSVGARLTRTGWTGVSYVSVTHCSPLVSTSRLRAAADGA